MSTFSKTCYSKIHEKSFVAVSLFIQGVLLAEGTVFAGKSWDLRQLRRSRQENRVEGAGGKGARKSRPWSEQAKVPHYGYISAYLVELNRRPVSCWSGGKKKLERWEKKGSDERAVIRPAAGTLRPGCGPERATRPPDQAKECLVSEKLPGPGAPSPRPKAAMNGFPLSARGRGTGPRLAEQNVFFSARPRLAALMDSFALTRGPDGPWPGPNAPARLRPRCRIPPCPS